MRSYFNAKLQKLTPDDLFGCAVCSSFCCVVPPVLRNEDEIKKALEYGGRVIAVAKGDGYIFNVAQNHHGLCPFVTEERGCQIYENRFQVCQEFRCRLQEHKIGSIIEMDGEEVINNLNAPITPHSPINLLPKEIVSRYGIEVLTTEEAMKCVNATEKKYVLAQLMMLYRKVSQIITKRSHK